MQQENKKWVINTLGGDQIADTGDYDDPFYELTNGDISLYTKDDVWDEDNPSGSLNIILRELNYLNAKWYQDDSHLHVIGYLERWKNEMYEFLEKKGLVQEYQDWSIDKNG